MHFYFMLMTLCSMNTREIRPLITCNFVLLNTFKIKAKETLTVYCMLV